MVRLNVTNVYLNVQHERQNFFYFRWQSSTLLHEQFPDVIRFSSLFLLSLDVAVNCDCFCIDSKVNTFRSFFDGTQGFLHTSNSTQSEVLTMKTTLNMCKTYLRKLTLQQSESLVFFFVSVFEVPALDTLLVPSKAPVPSWCCLLPFMMVTLFRLAAKKYSYTCYADLWIFRAQTLKFRVAHGSAFGRRSSPKCTCGVRAKLNIKPTFHIVDNLRRYLSGTKLTKCYSVSTRCVCSVVLKNALQNHTVLFSFSCYSTR